MADEESESVDFDETLLFREFDAEVATRETKVSKKSELPELRSLQRENELLKAALGKIVCYKSVGRATHAARSPLIQALFFDNKDSRKRRQQLEEFLQSFYFGSENDDESCSLGSENFQPSLSELNASRSVLVDSGDLESDSQTSFISSVRYFDMFCIDCTGFPLVELNPTCTDGWTIPLYEQHFFTVLPFSDEDAKVKIRQRKKCFNCYNEGHNVQDCPEPQNQAKIDANRREFMTKFSSPISKVSRYHVENAKRYGHFIAGVISDELREALGIAGNELPLHVYRMRQLGYPPAYIPSSSGESSLLIYDGEGNIDNSVMDGGEEEEEASEELHSLFIKYPGFNVPLPEGVVDRAWEFGMPPMQGYQQLNSMVNLYKQNRSRQETYSSDRKGQPAAKRKRVQLDQQDQQDMELDDQGVDTPLEIGQPRNKLNGDLAIKRRKYDDSGGEGGGYSPAHPGVECGGTEVELLNRYRRRSGGDKPPLPGDPLPQGPAVSSTKKRRCSREEGELVSEEEEEDEEEEEEEEAPRQTSGFWLKEPLAQFLEKDRKPRPPPRPPVVLPMDALTRFYTSCTVLQQHGFEDRIMWLDPVYGNVQVPSGRYERVKKILSKKTSRRHKAGDGISS